jgi:hypothetical protein
VDSSEIAEFKNYLKDEISGNPMMLNIATDKNFIMTMDQLVDQAARRKR